MSDELGPMQYGKPSGEVFWAVTTPVSRTT